MSLLCLADFKAQAQKQLSKTSWDFIEGEADDGITYNDNMAAFRRIRLRPRYLRDVSKIDTRTTIQGQEINAPICISPTAFHSIAWADGEKSTAKAAQKANICYVISSYASYTVEDIVAAAPGGLHWFQLYVQPDWDINKQMVQRIEALGFKALVVTVDAPILGNRRGNKRSLLDLEANIKLKDLRSPGECLLAGRTYDQMLTSLEMVSLSSEMFKPGLMLGDRRALEMRFARTGEQTKSKSGLPTPISMPSTSSCWNDLPLLQSMTRLPIILKGILTKEDAELAVKHNIRGIIVSNHGGRQLDEVPASIDALREVVAAVNGKIEVYMDGGVRTGNDVLKALALGARCIFLGRPIIWGLACKGEDGVKEVLDILKEELHTCMALSGCRSVAEISPDLIQFSRL